MTDDSVQPFANFQYEIYGRGLGGERPELPITYAGLEAAAREQLSAEAYGYVAGGAGAERTVRTNERAFERRELVPRMLRDVSERRLQTTVLQTEMPVPILLAPIGVQSIIHPEAELAVARAAAGLGLTFILSTAASNSMEQVAETAGDAPRWFQLYWPRGRDLAASMVGRAQRAGYRAIVVTLDNFLLSWRPRDLQGAYLPFLQGEGVANYFSDPVFRDALEVSPEEDQGAAIGQWAMQFPNPGVTWDDLEWLRGQTELPVLLKGVLHPDDARRAVECGVDGLVVSNHGGRQVDGAIASLDALPDIRTAVGRQFPVLLDSGVRSGADIVKALALGADAVCVGRPYVWGLALAGQAGVEHVLRCLLAEFDLTMALTGHACLADLDEASLRQRDGGEGNAGGR